MEPKQYASGLGWKVAIFTLFKYLVFISYLWLSLIMLKENILFIVENVCMYEKSLSF